MNVYDPLPLEDLTEDELWHHFRGSQRVLQMALIAFNLGVTELSSGHTAEEEVEFWYERSWSIGEELIIRGDDVTWFDGKSQR